MGGVRWVGCGGRGEVGGGEVGAPGHGGGDAAAMPMDEVREGGRGEVGGVRWVGVRGGCAGARGRPRPWMR